MTSRPAAAAARAGARAWLGPGPSGARPPAGRLGARAARQATRRAAVRGDPRVSPVQASADRLLEADVRGRQGAGGNPGSRLPEPARRLGLGGCSREQQEPNRMQYSSTYMGLSAFSGFREPGLTN